MARVRYFAAAAEAAGVPAEELAASTLGQLRQAMVAAHGPELARVLERCSVLVDGVTTTAPGASVGGDALVDVLPPFAGG